MKDVLQQARNKLRAYLSIWQHDTWVKPFFSHYRQELFVCLALGVGCAAFSCLLMFCAGYLISLAAEEPADGIFALFAPLGFVQIFALTKPFFNYFERLKSHDWVLRMTASLRRRLYLTLEKHALERTWRKQTGSILALLIQDIGHVQDLYLRSIFPLLIAWFLWALIVIALGFFSLLFSLFMLLWLSVACLFAPLLSLLINAARREYQSALQIELYTNTCDNVMGINDWILSGRKNDYVSSVCAGDAGLKKVRRRENKHAYTRDFIVQLGLGAVSAILLVWAAGVFGADASQIPAQSGFMGRSADWLAAFAIGFFPLIDIFTPLSDSTLSLSDHLKSVAHLNGIEQEISTGSSLSEELTTSKDNPSPPFDLELCHVCFSYGGSTRECLHDIDLQLRAGTKLAIVGKSGCGKSTLLGLIRGDLKPTCGSVRLSGVQTSSLGDTASRYMSFIQQDAYIFAATLLENLTLAKPGATEAEVLEAIEAVGLSGLLHRMPYGLATMIDEGGASLSGGERRRLALARALLQDCPLVLLDEPCVGLDPKTEDGVLDTFYRVFADKTVIMVTHHLAKIDAVDRVIFLEAGRVVLDGSPQALKEESAYFRRLLALDGASF